MSKSKHNHEVKDYSAKAPIIEEIKNLLDSCQSAVIVDYRGLTVEEDTDLRKKFRKSGRGVRGSEEHHASRRAADELGIDRSGCSTSTAPLLSLSASEDPVAPAKILKRIHRQEDKKMTVKCGIVDKQVHRRQRRQGSGGSAAPERFLSPRCMGSMNAPITGLVSRAGAAPCASCCTRSTLLRTPKDEDLPRNYHGNLKFRNY